MTRRTRRGLIAGTILGLVVVAVLGGSAYLRWSRPPRVGFVVTRGHEGVFLRCMAGALERLSPDAFEAVVLCSRTGQERIRGGIQSRAVRSLALPGRLDLAAEAVRGARCDVLCYWEVGTDPA